MRLPETLLIFLFTCAVGSAADVVPFAPPWGDAAPGSANISDTWDKPAGKSAFVYVRDGHLCAGEHRLNMSRQRPTCLRCLRSGHPAVESADLCAFVRTADHPVPLVARRTGYILPPGTTKDSVTTSAGWSGRARGDPAPLTLPPCTRAARSAATPSPAPTPPSP
jgi:hypothetical protein